MSLHDDAQRAIQESRRHERRAFDLATYAKAYVTASALAAYLEVDRRTIVRMIATGALDGVKVGRAWRIPTDAARETFHVKAAP